MRYMFLAYQSRILTEHCTFGELFYVCCDEVDDITLMEALFRILSVATERLRQPGIFCEKTFEDFYYKALQAAVSCLDGPKTSSIVFSMNPEN